MLSGWAVQEKGFGTVYSPAKALIAAWRSTTDRKTPAAARAAPVSHHSVLYRKLP